MRAEDIIKRMDFSMKNEQKEKGKCNEDSKETKKKQRIFYV